MRPTIEDVLERIKGITGIPIESPLCKNKGSVGHLLEEKLGIPKSSACLDCEDGEIKVFPLKRLKNGKLVAKESVAVTMLSTTSLEKDDFCSSKCYQKMKRMLMVPYLRDDTTILFYSPTLIELKEDILSAIQADYDAIREDLVVVKKLQSRTGVYLQNRTKGPGGDIKTRAYYLRPTFMNTFVRFE